MIIEPDTGQSVMVCDLLIARVGEDPMASFWPANLGAKAMMIRLPSL